MGARRDAVAATIALALGLATAAGCRPEGDGRHYGTVERVGGRGWDTLYLNNFSEPEYIDPGLTAESAGSTLTRAMNEGLVGVHPEDLRPTAGVAQRWAKSDDNRLFRFWLRRDAKWSDGVPVVAAQFVDAWQRVLTPKTGARMATNMYVLHGGALFHQGRLLTAKRDLALEPLANGEAATLKGGEPVVVHKRLPVRALLAPLADAERPAVDVGAPAEGTAAPEAKIVALGGAVKCNGEKDRWYAVEVGGARGWLPGCALAESAPAPGQRLLVSRHRLPTFEKAKAKDDTDAPIGVGVASSDALVADPAVLGVRAVSEHELEVELARPTPYFLELLATPTYYPVRKEVIAAHGDAWTRPEHIVTNGAYTLTEHKFRYEIVLEKNPHHWEAERLKLNRIVWLAVTDNFSTLNLYKTGEIDWIGENVALPPAFMGALERYGDYHPSVWIATYWYEINTQKPPVDKREVRCALDLAIDKQQLIDKITRGGQLPATHFVPPYTGSGYSEVHAADVKAGRDPFAGRDFDPARARALMAEAGYPVVKTADGWEAQGFPSLEVVFNSSEAHRKVAVALQGMWRAHLGVTVQVRNEEWKVMLKTVRDGNFQLARGGWVGDYNHPHTWLDTFLSFSENNWAKWKSPQFDARVQEAAEEGDPERSIRLYREAEKMAVDACVRIPLYFYTKHTMMKPYLKGNWPNAANTHPVKYMWLDPNWRDNPENTTAFPVEELPAPEAF